MTILQPPGPEAPASHRLDRRRKWLVAVALLCVAASADAARLFKCVQSDGVPSFQSAPCVTAGRQVWVREVIAEPLPPPAVPATARSRPPPRRAVRSVSAQTPHAAATCAAAREAAADERDRRWREISIDDLRRLDAQLERACRRR